MVKIKEVYTVLLFQRNSIKILLGAVYFMFRILLHQNYGSFKLSQTALKHLINIGWVVSEFNENHLPVNPNADILLKKPGSTYGHVSEELSLNWFKFELDSIEFRTNSDLLDTVDILGYSAGSNLFIKELDISEILYISSNDGYESLKSLNNY